jgi:hypothetical protein
MDADRFALLNLLRALSEASSRRGIGRALGSLALGSALGARGLAEATAGKRRKKRRRRNNRKHKQNQNQNQPPPHVCQGRDACVGDIGDVICGAESNCYCFVTAEGETYCGKGNGVNSCQECEEQFPGRDCFPGTGPNCSPFSCAEPCPV